MNAHTSIFAIFSCVFACCASDPTVAGPPVRADAAGQAGADASIRHRSETAAAPFRCDETTEDMPCTDPALCITHGFCFEGSCRQFSGDDCHEGPPCRAGECYKGVCYYQKVVDSQCSDGNPCTIDRCDPLRGCVHTDADGKTCEDGNPCLAATICDKGWCVGFSKDCDDDNACTLDSCSPFDGCVHKKKIGCD